MYWALSKNGVSAFFTCFCHFFFKLKQYLLLSGGFVAVFVTVCLLLLPQLFFCWKNTLNNVCFGKNTVFLYKRSQNLYFISPINNEFGQLFDYFTKTNSSMSLVLLVYKMICDLGKKERPQAVGFGIKCMLCGAIGF